MGHVAVRFARPSASDAVDLIWIGSGPTRPCSLAAQILGMERSRSGEVGKQAQVDAERHRPTALGRLRRLCRKIEGGPWRMPTWRPWPQTMRAI